MDLTEILKELHQWLESVHIPAEILTDSTKTLRVIFETENALAELLAGNGEYAPYRFISFTVLDPSQDSNAEPVFRFCDDDSHTINDILLELNRGMAVMETLSLRAPTGAWRSPGGI